MFDIYAHHWPGVVFIDHWHSNTWRKSAEKNEEHLTHVWMLNVRAWLVLVTYLCQKAIKKCYSYSVARIIWDPLETHRYVIVRCQCKQFQCSIYSNMTFIRWRKTQIVNLYSKLIRAQCRILIETRAIPMFIFPHLLNYSQKKTFLSICCYIFNVLQYFTSFYFPLHTFAWIFALHAPKLCCETNITKITVPSPNMWIAAVSFFCTQNVVAQLIRYWNKNRANFSMRKKNNQSDDTVSSANPNKNQKEWGKSFHI